MAKERHTAAFVVGMMIGGAAGAAVTLWKTPMSGAQVRARFTATAESVKRQVIAVGERLGIELGETEPAPPPAMTVSETEPIPSPIPSADADVPPPVPTALNFAPSVVVPEPQPGSASSPPQTVPGSPSSAAAIGSRRAPNP